MKLPLYPNGLPKAPIEQCEKAELDRSCTKCELHTTAGKQVCMPPEGEPGGILIVGEKPSLDDVRSGRLLSGFAGRNVRGALRKAGYTGPVAFDMALKCYPAKTKLTEKKHVEPCRPYLAATIAEVKPTRIIALGTHAMQSLLGRHASYTSVRKGYAYIGDIPVFFTLPSDWAALNPFTIKWLEEDIAWAISCELPPKPPGGSHAYIVDSAATSQEAVAQIRAQVAQVENGWFSFDCETMGRQFDPDFRITSLAICAKGTRDAYVWTREALASAKARDPLMKLLADPNVHKIGSNVKYDALSSKAFGHVTVNGLVGDTMLWRKLLYSDADADLETMQELVGMGGGKGQAQAVLSYIVSRLNGNAAKATEKVAPELLPYIQEFERDWEDESEDTEIAKAAVKAGAEPLTYAYGLLPFNVAHTYCALDTVSTAALGEYMEPKLRADQEVWAIWQKILQPAVPAFTQMEAWGVRCDKEAITKLGEELAQRIKEAEVYFDRFQEVTREECTKCPKKAPCKRCNGTKVITTIVNFSPSSSQQVAELLFTKLKLKSLHKTPKGAPCTDVDSLEAIKDAHPVVHSILEWRRLEKLRGTYAEGLAGHIRADGRIHPDFKVGGARSGRLSCAQPNLQNIGRASANEDNRALRACFAAEPGNVLVECDYATLEIRVAAMMSGDPVMREILLSGVDYHRKTAEMIAQMVWNITPDQITDEHRNIAKTFNFSVMYGQGDDALAEGMGVSKQVAATVRAAIMGKFKVLARWINERIQETTRTGECRTWWDGQLGRRRCLVNIASQMGDLASKAKNGSYNSPVQGTASEFCLSSVIALVNWVLQEKLDPSVRVVLTIHDSITIECREDLAPMVAQKMKAVMEGWNSNGIPLIVDAKVGPNLGAMRKWDIVAGQYAPEKKKAV